MEHRAANSCRDAGQAVGAYQHYALARLRARKGRYAEATELLEQAHKARECSDAEALDLQARIYVQQGRYLDAESCWRKAQSLDEVNPAYADALCRLREIRRPTPHLYGITTVAVALFMMLLLVWQTLIVNPALRYRQRAAEQSLSEIRDELASSREGSLSQDREFASAFARLAEALQDLDRRLSARVENVATLSGVNAVQDAVIKYVDERLTVLGEKTLAQSGDAAKERSALAQRIAALDGALVQRLADINGRWGKSDAAQSEQIETLRVMMRPLGERLAAAETAMGKRLDTVESDIRRDMKLLASTSDMASIERVLLQLQREVEQMMSTLRELTPPEEQDPPGADQGDDAEPIDNTPQ